LNLFDINIYKPDHYSVIESLTSILSPGGLIGVIDFYVQSKVEFGFRNYTGGFLGRHVNWFMRTFWRAWFDLDRVSLEASRRDCLEYKFGTVLTVNARNSTLFGIPYYIWIGCQKKLSYDVVKKADALGTNSSFPLQISARLRSKGSVVATQNISANLPLPSFFYQNQHWRVYYDDNLRKHTQFNNEYIYAFTWEDSQVDDQILNLNADDVVLAITSAGDNILSYSMKSPARIHSVDLNPTQNHLLELKMACYTSLPYEDFWLLFGEGRHPEFRTLLLNTLSPHLSSRAFQYWLNHVHVFSGQERSGLYDTGGSRHGIRIFRWISCLFGCRSAVQKFLVTKSLNEQRELWFYKIRPVLLSNIVCKLIVGQESFLWSALGVPKHQLAMIEKDHAESEAVTGPAPSDRKTRSHAIWRYMVNTLDPVAEQTHISMDNPYYHVCMAGQFSRECHPDYLSRKAHTKLSRPGALDRISIHTDEVDEVLRHMTPGSLTVAVIMDSMDWFDPHSAAATVQITNLNRTLKMGGRVLLRSSALCPWYIKIFEDHGFSSRCMGSRTGGMCIDRVNMYASCWLCTKTENLPLLTPEMESMDGSDIDSFFA
jgi:betaine lipid synthase